MPPVNALNLEDPSFDVEAGARDTALAADPDGEDELSKPLCELPVAEQAKNETEMKVCNLSIFHVNAVSPIIIDGAGQGLSTSTIRTEISNYRKENKILWHHTGQRES